MSALEAAMRQCVSAQQGAAACLGVSTGSRVDQAKADGVAPMDVVDEGAVGGGKSSGGVGASSGGAAANGSVGVVGKGSEGARKGELGAVPVGENGIGR